MLDDISTPRANKHGIRLFRFFLTAALVQSSLMFMPDKRLFAHPTHDTVRLRSW